MKRLLMVLLCGMGLFAEETVSRVRKLKYFNPENSISLLSILAGKQVRWHSDPQLKMIAISGPLELVDALEDAIKALDVPPPAVKNVELTFHLLLASTQPDGGGVPADLNGVATQLRNVFGLKSVRVLETSVIRGREGRQIQTSGVAPSATKLAETAPYSITVKSTAVTASEKGTTIRLDGLQFSSRVPTGTPGAVQYQAVGLSTDLDVHEGQKVVVGKSNIDGAAQSLFLVVTAKLVD